MESLHMGVLKLQVGGSNWEEALVCSKILTTVGESLIQLAHRLIW